MNEEKTYVEDVDRSIYDFKDDEKDAFKLSAGLTPAIVEQISREKHDPAWMQLFRLQSLQIYQNMRVPDWGPSIEGLNMDNIVTYVRPNTGMKAKWSDVPEDIKNTFERLGIPQAERKSLAGVGAQYDSELVYHNVREEVAAQGVVYTDMESALTGPYADMVKKHFMKLVKPTDHKFAALHGAVWSGGSFVYVPKGVKVEIPLQSYFRLNAPGAGQFEHTLIIVDEGADLHFIEGCSAPKYNVANLHAGCVELFVGKNARLRYSTIENWSKNMYNLNTKRGRRDRVGFRLVWFACFVSVSDEHFEWTRLPHGVYGHHLCRQGAEPRYRREGRSQRAGYQFLYQHALHFQGRRHQHVPLQRSGGQKREERQILRLLSVPDARFHLSVGHHSGDGYPNEGRERWPRGADRFHQRRSRVLPDEPRHERRGRARVYRQRLCGQCIQGTAA